MRKTIIIAIILLLIPVVCMAAWQDTLEENFDIVSTFDELQTWSASGVGYFYYPTVNTLPKKLDGSQSMWTGYSGDGLVKSDWIGDQGPGYVWNGSKALCINYRDLFTPGITTYSGYGPSRLGVYFGDGTPNSGYNNMHVFFMMKFHDGFFVQTSPGVFVFTPVVKLFEAMAGFSAINYWGSVDEHATACNDVRMLTDYGANDVVFNVQGGGASTPNKLFFYENTFLARYFESPKVWNNHTDCWTWSVERNRTYPSADFSAPYLNNQWFGVEINLVTGDQDTANGSLTFKLYNESGTLVATESHTNQVMIRGFAHKYNKWIFGGNFNTGGAGYTQSNETRYYVDDFIINDTEIAPTYFALLAGLPTYDQPTITIDDTNTGMSSSGTITGTYTIDDELSAGLCTWSHSGGSVTGFATVLLGVVSGTVTGIPVGDTVVTFTLEDSAGQEATYTAVFTRSEIPVSGNATSTAVMSGCVFQ